MARDLPAADEGAPADLRELFVREHQAMVRLAALLIDDEARAEELVQDAFVRVHRRWDRIDDHGAYLRTAVVNACRSELRRRMLVRRRRDDLRAAAEAAVRAGPPDDPALSTVDADPGLIAALARLPHRRKAAIVLRCWADLSDADIAATLGVRPPTVRTLVHRGLAQLREELDR